MRKLLLIPFLFAGCADDHEPTPSEIADWEAAFEQVSEGKADTTGCNGVKVPDQGNFGKRIALTFDDGPNPATTPKILETLRRHNAPATFFVLGNAASTTEGQRLVQEMIEDPMFLVGSHTWDHQNMANLGSDAAIAEVDRTTAAIENAGQGLKWFRFPYGSSTCATADLVRSRELVITGWHIDSADWCYEAGDGYCRPSTFRYVEDAYRDSMSGFILSQLRRTNGGILLFHDTKTNTARELDGILTRLEAEGYTFVGLEDTSAFPLLNGIDPATLPFIGDACAADADCGGQISGHDAFCLGGFCSASCEGYCPDRGDKAATFCAPDPTQDGARGVCVSKSTSGNGHCADVPNTIDVDSERYVGGSSAPRSTAEVCLPSN